MIGLGDPPKGILFIVAGVTAFSLQDVAIKSLSSDYPVHEIVFIRSLVAIMPILVIQKLEGGTRLLSTGRPRLHLLRSGALLASYFSYYLAMASLPLADTVAIFFSAPLFVTALSVLVLGEPVSTRRWAAILVGFLGVVIMMRPGAGVIDPAAALAILAALTYATAAVVTRRLGETDASAAMTFYTVAFYLMASALVGLALGGNGLIAGQGKLAKTGHASLQFLLRAWKLPSWTDLGLMALCGLLAALAFYFITQAYSTTRATTVTPFEYIAVPLSVIFGYIFWQDVPGLETLVGMVLVVGSGLYVLRRASSQA